MNSNNQPTTNGASRIRTDVTSMSAYAIQDAAGMVKLDAMENPYRLSEELQGALGARLGAVAINRYPGSNTDNLKAALRNYAQIPSEHGITLGNGSDEFISLIAMACDTRAHTAQRAVILAPLPGFVMYEMGASHQGLDFIGVALTENFELDEAAMIAAVNEQKPAITFIAYPNNPTANLWDAQAIRNIINAVQAIDGIVVIDEAYQPFSALSWINEVKANPAANANVIIMRTLSKFGIAGVRLGYAFGPPELINEIDKIRPPYNISSLNIECALFALEHADEFAKQAASIREERGRMMGALQDLPNATVFPSDANMILVRLPNAAATFAHLKTQGILVKNVSGMHPLLTNCLRLTVGTPGENTLLLTALRTSP
jgi:histidinol-phosphate aminotransferase